MNGKLINYLGVSSLDELPTRDSFINKKIDCQGAISRGEPILFMPINFKEIHETIKGKYSYNILYYGAFSNGQKASIVLTDIDVYFEIKVPEGENLDDVAQKTESICREQFDCNVEITTSSHRAIDKWRPNELSYVKIKTDTLWDRRRIMDYFISTLGYETINDDKNHYERAAFRNLEKKLGQWNVLTNYTHKKCRSSKLHNNLYVSIYNFNECDDNKIASDMNLVQDKTIIRTWDIEAYTSTGEFPNPMIDDDVVFNISLGYYWKSETQPLLLVGLISRQCEPRPGYLTILCKDQRDLLTAAFEIDRRMQPDYISGFNDGDFDWQFCITKAQMLGILLPSYDALNLYESYSEKKKTVQKRIEDILKWSCRKHKIKITADTNAFSTTIQCPNYINIDTRTVFRKMYPTSLKSSLKFFLEKMNMSGKDDMPIHRLFDIYRVSLELEKKWNTLSDRKRLVSMHKTADEKVYSSLSEYEVKVATMTDADYKKAKKDVMTYIRQNMKDMADINQYCVIDAQRCQDLLVKASTIDKHRAVANLSYTTLTDTFFYADGMRVLNMTIAWGQRPKFNLAISTRPNYSAERGNYGGGHVFDPVNGIVAPKLSLRERKEKFSTWKNVSEEEIREMEKCVALGIMGDKYAESFKTHGDFEYVYAWRDAMSTKKDKKERVKTENKRNDYPLRTDLVDYQPVPEYCMPNEKETAINNLKLSNTSRKLFVEFLDEKSRYPKFVDDFASLYPSIIRAYNYSPEYIIYTEEDAKLAESLGHVVIKKCFQVDGIDFISWVVQHDTTDGKTIHKGKTVNKFGIYPYILNELFWKRAAVKKQMKKVDTVIESMKHRQGSFTPKEEDDFKILVLKRAQLNISQLALKVYMNTFYGVCGNPSNALYNIYLAGNVTVTGRMLIKQVAKWGTERGFVHWYGDTDSWMSSCPLFFFEELDRKYYSGQISKIDYATALVAKTFEVIPHFTDMMNTKLIEMSKGVFLKLAYEEVIYPGIAFVQKMYCGVMHEKMINFYPLLKDVFTRGLAIKRRDASRILKIISGEVLMEVLSIHNTRTLREITMSKLKEIAERKWEMTDFAQSGVYKPAKNNIAMHVFHDRMEKRNDPFFPPPKPSERFNFVVIEKCPFTYETNGKLVRLKVGDKMEYLQCAIKHQLSVDLTHYITGGISAQFAQFLIDQKQFYSPPLDNTKEGIKKARDKTLGNAKKFVEAEWKKYYTVDYKSQDKTRKGLYKLAKERYTEYFGNKGPTQMSNTVFESKDKYNMWDEFVNSVTIDAKKAADTFGTRYIEYVQNKWGKDIVYVVIRVFRNKQSNLLKTRDTYLAQTKEHAKRQFLINADKFTGAYCSMDETIREMVDKMKNALKLYDNNDNISTANTKAHESDEKMYRLGIADLRKDEKLAKICADVGKLATRIDITDTMDILSQIRETVYIATKVREETASVIKYAQLAIDQLAESAPRPADFNNEEERKSAINFIRDNLIDLG